MILRVYLNSARRWNAPLRRWERSFVTGAQKRALQQNQVSASSKEPPKPAVPPPVPPTAAFDSNQLVPIGIASGVALAAGGAYYYYNKNSAKDDKTAEVIVKEEAKAPAGAPSPPAVAASDTPKVAPSSSPPEKKTPSTASKAATPKDIPVTVVTASSGNRVTSIAVPDKMKNTVAASAVAVEHPADGNRVSVLLSPPKDEPAKDVAQEEAKVKDTASTQTAVEELQSATTFAATESLLQSHQSLWATSDSVFMNVDSLEKLSIPQLQARVLQLAAELKDRTRWEAIRLKEFLVMKEKETTDK
jgi:vacuolar-type H+-ATPase subunit D/Vma8